MTELALLTTPPRTSTVLVGLVQAAGVLTIFATCGDATTYRYMAKLFCSYHQAVTAPWVVALEPA